MKHIVFLIFLLPTLGFCQYTESEWEERDSWMPLEEIYELANIKESMKVADIGCHEGYLSIHLAKIVGNDGRVYAVDVRADRLEKLSEHLEERNLRNVSVILGDYDNPKLPKETLDVVVIMDTYHEITDYMTMLAHAKTALKPGGRIVIIEKQKLKVRDQSRSSQTDAHSMTVKYVSKELMSAGFKQLIQKSKMAFWEKDTEKVMWMLVATKPE